MAVTVPSWVRGADPGLPPVEPGPVDLDAAAPDRPVGAPLQHGGAPTGGDPVGAPAGRGRGVALALGLAATASLLTGTVVHHRAEALVAGGPPRLEVGYPEVRSAPPARGALRAQVVLPVLNAGTEPVEVTAVALTERAGPVTLERAGVELEPGERTRVAVEAGPRCDLAATGEADVAAITVRGPGGEHTVSTELAAPFGRPALDAQLDGLCAATARGRPVDVAVSLLPDDRTLVLRMTNTSTQSTDLALWAPSASGIVSDPPLPLELGPGEEVSLNLTALPRCETWSGGLPSMSVDVVSSRPANPDGVSRSTDRDVPSGWSALLTSWLGGQVTRACDLP